jgi:competence protein ComEC
MIPLPDGLYHRPAIPATLALIAGILLGEGLPGLAVAALLVFLLATVPMVMGLTRRLPVRWSPLLATMAVGYLSMLPWTAPQHGPTHIVNYLDTGYWRIRGTVLDPPMVRFGRTRVILSMEALSRKEKAEAVRGRIRLTVMGETQLAPGDRLTFPARIRSLRNFSNPGAFDYRRAMGFRGIHGSAWVQAEKLRLIGHHHPLPAIQVVRDLRRVLGRMIDVAADERALHEKAVLKALIFGDRSGIDSGLRERFNRSGVGHLLAISGLHVGIVAVVVFWSLLWGFSFCPPLLWRGWGRAWAAVGTLVVVIGYGVLAGMSPSTQRAVIMVTVFLAAVIAGRTNDTLNTLALAALVILILFPPALFSISFQLSFAAVLAIVYGLAKIGVVQAAEAKPGHPVGHRLVGFVLVSVLAIAGTTPIVLFHFNQTSLVGVAANLFLVPLVGFVVVPLGLAAALMALFFEAVAVQGFWLCIKILHLALAVVDFYSGLSFAAVKTVTPSLLEIALYYVVGWALLNLRQVRPAPWVLAAALVMAAGDGFYWSYQRFWHKDLKVTAIDVGQGASTLLELPGGTIWLYDGGGFSDNRLFDMGQRVVAPLLWRKKIATVDTLILSHPNADHLNGLIYIAKHFNVRELWTNGDVNNTQGFRQLMTVCRRNQIAVRRFDSGSGEITSGPVASTVLNPGADFLQSSHDRDQEARNNGSLVFKTTFGKTAFLLTGDIMTSVEDKLVLHAAAQLPSTVLFAPHHGSRTSSSPGLIAAVRPEVVVISAGAGNRFGFPHAEVVARYRAAGCRILCTGTHGAISMRSDGTTVEVRTFADGIR